MRLRDRPFSKYSDEALFGDPALLTVSNIGVDGAVYLCAHWFLNMVSSHMYYLDNLACKIIKSN